MAAPAAAAYQPWLQLVLLFFLHSCAEHAQSGCSLSFNDSTRRARVRTPRLCFAHCLPSFISQTMQNFIYHVHCQWTMLNLSQLTQRFTDCLADVRWLQASVPTYCDNSFNKLKIANFLSNCNASSGQRRAQGAIWHVIRIDQSTGQWYA